MAQETSRSSSKKATRILIFLCDLQSPKVQNGKTILTGKWAHRFRVVVVQGKIGYKKSTIGLISSLVISRFECRMEYPVQFETRFYLFNSPAEIETMHYRLSRQMRGSGGWIWKDLMRLNSNDIDNYVRLTNNGTIFGDCWQSMRTFLSYYIGCKIILYYVVYIYVYSLFYVWRKWLVVILCLR